MAYAHHHLANGKLVVLLPVSVQAHFREEKVMPEPKSTAHARVDGLMDDARHHLANGELVVLLPVSVQAHFRDENVTPEPKPTTHAGSDCMTERT